jgi:hypothetical protein
VISAFETNLEARAEPRGISDRDANECLDVIRRTVADALSVLAEHNGDGKARLITAAKRNGPMRAVGVAGRWGQMRPGSTAQRIALRFRTTAAATIRVYALSLSHRFIWGLI